MIKILFVCLGNICRSPAAHAIFQYKVDKLGLKKQFIIDSAGTAAYHKGELPDERMREHGARRGYVLNSPSRPICEQDFDIFDMIITMDDQNHRNVKKMMSKQQLNKLYKMTTYNTLSKLQEVPDPYFGGAKGFEQVFDLLDNSCENLLKTLLDKNN